MGSKSSKKTPTAGGATEAKDLTLDQFNLGKVLGEGTFAEVRMAISKDGASEAAVKILYDTNNIPAIENEIKCMKKTAHPNSIKLLGSETSATYNKKPISYLILELANNGELFQILAMTGAFDEDIARLFAKQLYGVVDFFHSKNVTHRDLKPENILLDSQCSIKIADFGLATEFTESKMTELVGSPGYIAPEVYEGKYHKENDIWAACVIHFIMMTGCPPFRRAKTDDWWYNKLKDKKWDRWWKAHYKNSNVELSADAKSLFQMIFEIDPAKRPDVKKILAHDWFKGTTCAQKDLMERFHGRMADDGDYLDYKEEDGTVELDDGVTHRAAGDEKYDPNGDDAPPLMNYALKRGRVAGGGDGVGDDVVTRGGDEGDEKAEAAEEYKHGITCYTKFTSELSPSGLYEVLQTTMRALDFTYSNNGTYKMTCKHKTLQLETYIGDGDVPQTSKLEFNVQVYTDGADTPKSIITFTRSKGNIRDFMGAYVSARNQMSDVIYRPTKTVTETKTETKTAVTETKTES